MDYNQEYIDLLKRSLAGETETVRLYLACMAVAPPEHIPKLLEMYNEAIVTGGKGGFIPSMYVNALPEDKRPDACIGCGSCAAVCPQQIDIPGTLADFAAKLAG